MSDDQLPAIYSPPTPMRELAAELAYEFDRHRRTEMDRAAQAALEESERARVAYELAQEKLRDAVRKRDQAVEAFGWKLLRLCGGPSCFTFPHDVEAFHVADSGDVRIYVRRRRQPRT